MKGKRFRFDRGGRKLTDVELEEVLSWIQRRSNMLRVSGKLIMFKVKSIYGEKCGDNEELKAGFVASNGWLTKFMKMEQPFYAKTNNNSAKGPFPPYD